MTYEPLRKFNPTIEDMTLGSSKWLMSRILPGIGKSKICAYSDTLGMVTLLNEDVKSAAILPGNLCFVISGDTLKILSEPSPSFIWRGRWEANEGIPAVFGQNEHGAFCAFNTFNVGQRFVEGWRPSIVD